MKNTVLIIATLDTKKEETMYLKNKLEAHGLSSLLMDISMGDTLSSTADITPSQIFEAGGSSQEEIANSKERSWMTQITTAGASKIAGELFHKGEIDGVISVGGSTGSLMATDVMRSLPFGLPKLMVSSTAALPGMSTRYIGTGDIILFHSVVEVSSVTNALKSVLDRAANAMVGMVSHEVTSAKTTEDKAIAMTMLGPCEKCASSVRKALEQKGYQVIGFSAAGISDKAMEEMISQGLFQGVIDLAPGGVGEHLFGFMRDAGPKRLESAGEIAIPQVISTCSVNHMTPAKSKYKPDFYERRKYDLDKFRTWIRLSPEELTKVAHAFAEKLNRAHGAVKMVIPLQGWSSVDAPGNQTYDPTEDRIFIEEVSKQLTNPGVEIREDNHNMEDPEFANIIVEEALKIL